MQIPSAVNSEIISKKLLEHWGGYINLWKPFQSFFLSGLYKKYHCLDSGQLVLFFAKKTHQSILRKKDYNLNFDLSFEKFWENHSEAENTPSTILAIAKESNIPKETARRKISELMKQKVLARKHNHISWQPSEEYKKSYNILIAQEIEKLAELTKFVTDKMNLNFSTDEIITEFKKNFCFYWFHYLNLQLEWMKIWKSKIKDLEIVHIIIEIVSVLTSKTKENFSIEDFYNNSNTIFRFENMNISATTIADITGIPRSTCMRKLNQIAKQKMIKQDQNTNKYIISPEILEKNFSKDFINKSIQIYSKFYFIYIQALSFKISK